MSRHPRFFITPDQVQGRRIVLTGDDMRHIRTVLRKQPGDVLTLPDGQGTEYTVRIIELDRAGIITEIEDQARREPGGPQVILGQGLPKSDKMDLIVQKATELGVSSIVPLVTGRTIVRIRDEEKRLSRWQKIAREAAMQSSRPDIPLIKPVQPFREFILSPVPGPPPPAPASDDPGPGTLFLLPWEEGTQPLRHVLRQHADATTIVVLIGPEGGFSSSEAELAREQGFRLVSLGRNILRTETAAIAVLSMIAYEFARDGIR